MSKRQQISISNKDSDIIPFLKKKPNISQYIIKLIRKDMSANNEEFKKKVIKVINDYCDINCEKQNIQDECSTIKNAYDAIKDIFEM